MKTCTRCLKLLPILSFYIETRRGSKYTRPECKTCLNNRVRIWKITNREHVKESMRAWSSNNRAHIRAYQRKWYSENKKRLLKKTKTTERKEYEKMYKLKEPKKQKARITLRNAIALGNILKPDFCSECNKQFPKHQIHGHHYDYLKPTSVIWLCQACHGKAHRYN